MKERSTSQSAFFNLRALIGLSTGLAGVFLALLGFGMFSAQAQQKYNAGAKSLDPLVPPMFDCSKIHELGIDKQENMRAGAIMIFCGQSQGGAASPDSAFSKLIQKLLPAPLAYGTTDVDLITGTETFPDITQSETFTAANPDNPFQIVVAYNDSRGRFVNPINIAGASVSTDGGNTFVRLTKANGQSPFDNTYGGPVILYNRPTGTWYTSWIDPGCGSQGIGGYKSTTPWDPNSWTHYCIHSGVLDDRGSGWTDNNPSSPFYGRMYVSWNDFHRSQALFVRYSTDNGATWTNERQLTTPFIRNVQITGDLATGDVYVAGMDEGGGGLTDRSNLFFRSTDGGNTWTNTYTGPTFPGPGRVVCSGNTYFACMYTDGGGYWRHMGWGEPAALNGVVHYVYAARDTGNGDPGNVFYIRSTDRGVTFSAPFQLNTDATTRAQWQPNLSVSSNGSLFAVWYDERETASCQEGNPAVPCYRMWARRSTDNGATWLADDMFSDVVSPLPGQPDPGIVSFYASDYDYGISSPIQHLSAWVDGRVTINSASQPDAFHDRQWLGLAVTSTDPCVGCVVFTQPTDFVVNVTDPVDPTTLQGSDFTINGTPADTVSYTPGTTTMTFHFNSTPVQNQGLQTMHISAGAFERASDHNPVLEFNGTFRYDALLLQVTTTVPPVGGTFTGPGTVTYDVNFNEQFDPTSVQTTDLTLSGVPGTTVTNVSFMNGNTTAEFTLNFTSMFSGTLTASIAAGAITDQFGNPCAAFSGNYQYATSLCDSGIIQNEGFETGDFTDWTIDGNSATPVVTNTQAHSGTYSGFVGDAPDGFCGFAGHEPNGDSSFYQQFTIPASGGTLSFWHWDCSVDTITFDWQDAYITNAFGTILQTIFHQALNGRTWIQQTVNMAPYAGQTVRIKFLVHEDMLGDLTGMYVDDVALYEPCGTPTPTPTPASPTPTATPTATPIATPTPVARPTPTPRPRPTAAPRPTP